MQTSGDARVIPENKEALDTAAAAERLRLPIAALEQALVRGFVDGFRDDHGRWVVLLDRPAAYPEPQAPAPPDESSVDGGEELPANEPPATDDDDATVVPEPVPEPIPEPIPEPVEDADAPPPASPTEPADALGYLRDEVRFLRDELARRDHMLQAKDDAMAKLVQRFAEMNTEIVQRVPSADTIQSQIAQSHHSQRQVAERHEKELNTIRDVLRSVRGYLAKQNLGDER